MNKAKINSNDFPERMGAYSHGYVVEIGDSKLIFTTGQIAMDKDGRVLYPNEPEKQAEYVYESLRKILKEAGASLDDVVKTTVFLTNMDDFSKISKVRNKYFQKSEPVSTLVEVKRLVKPECLIEVEVLAVIKK